ncbi:MAG: flagellar basal body rod protein FlgC [Henriciella sp.]
MNPFKMTMMQAASGMELQTKRIGVNSENLSNADTPGYKRKMLITEQASFGDQLRTSFVTLDETQGDQTYDPTHPMADAQGYVTGSNVSLVIEMADMRDANRQYEANLNSFQQARTMYTSLLDILRR